MPVHDRVRPTSWFQGPLSDAVVVRPRRHSWILLLVLAFLLRSIAASAQETASVEPPPDPAEERPVVIAVAPFQSNSVRNIETLTQTLVERLSERLGAPVGVTVLDGLILARALAGSEASELPDSELRALAARTGADAVISGSLTELASRFSLDVRVTPASAAARSQTIAFAAANTEELLGGLDELAARVSAAVSGGGQSRVVAIAFEGAGGLEGELRGRIETKPGQGFDGMRVRKDLERLEAHPGIASVELDTVRGPEGVTLRFNVIRSERIGFGGAPSEGGERIADLQIRGNRRIESDAIRARIRSRKGQPLRRSQIAGDVREVFGLGFFSDVEVFIEESAAGPVLIFQVAENPVVRQISISGNDNIDGDKIRDILTLTTGSTLDRPLLYENEERIEALYRTEGYYLAAVDVEIDPLSEGSVSINFDIDEKKKLKLEKIVFEGNEAFSNSDLTADFASRTWKLWSPATSWFDKSGTYSEPIVMRDLRTVEKLYTDAGFLQVDIGEPDVEATEGGLIIHVDIREGPQFEVGEIDVAGDATMDLDALQGRLQLDQGQVFNRSHLTQDVEALERYYTDRGFYFARVTPNTRVDEAGKTVDVEFQVEKGPLYFIRHIDISGNTRTVDKVVRREMRVVEGQLYSARALQVSSRRVRSLGFFEDMSFEPRPTQDPAQLDLDVRVVERPTGSFSFGAGFSSRDGIVLNASLSQSNLFGLGYAVNLSADIGGSTNRYFLSVVDPYFLGSQFSAAATIFSSQVDFDSFKQEQTGVDISFGHSLSEDNTSRGAIRYSYSRRKVVQDTGVNAAAVIFRELLQGVESSSLIGLSFRTDTRDDRLVPTEGMFYSGNLDYSGLGGFTKFLRVEGRWSWYLGAPDWLPERSTFVINTRIGYALSLNKISDYSFNIQPVPGCFVPGACVNVANLEQIDTDQTLPLTERYFLGGIGNFPLRGFKARSVGPRRSILKRNNISGTGNLFSPLGTENVYDPVTGTLTAVCNDTTGINQGNRNGRCNNINDRNPEDFDDPIETDIIGGNKFIAINFEYRFPISEEIGIQGLFFFDMGNAFAEGDNLFNVKDWRYGYGAGLLWFSPFGPLQVVLGFPVDKRAFEKSPVFEFSVGGVGL